MEISFEGKRVLVTGGGRGIGRELCKALVAAKAEKVYAASRTKENLDKLVAEEPKVIPIVVDLTSWDDVQEKLCALDRIDCLVNNAGTIVLEEFFDIKPESIDQIFGVNVKAIINVSQVIARGMVERKSGSIVNVSSRASKIMVPLECVYAASKAAVDGISQAMALELGQYNIRVNTVNPTVVWTDMGKKVWSDPTKSGPLLERHSLRRFAEPQDVVNTILWLLSDKASMISAVTLLVDGGSVHN